MSDFIFLLNKVIQPTGSEPVAPVETAAPAVQEAAASVPPDDGFLSILRNNSGFTIVMYIVLMFGALYLFSIRPQRKKEQQQTEMRKGIRIGDSVLLTNGMFGNVVDITEECFIVEFGTNKGIKIPVVKSEIAMIRTPNLSAMKEEYEGIEEKKK